MQTKPLTSSSTPNMCTSGKPTKSSHMRVGSVSTGALRSVGVRDRQTGRAPALSQGPVRDSTPRSDPKSRFEMAICSHCRRWDQHLSEMEIESRTLGYQDLVATSHQYP